MAQRRSGDYGSESRSAATDRKPRAQTRCFDPAAVAGDLYSSGLRGNLLGIPERCAQGTYVLTAGNATARAVREIDARRKELSVAQLGPQDAPQPADWLVGDSSGST